jgi:hypothetical protein
MGLLIGPLLIKLHIIFLLDLDAFTSHWSGYKSPFVRLSIRTHVLENGWTDFHEILYWEVLLKCVLTQSSFGKHRTTITGTYFTCVSALRSDWLWLLPSAPFTEVKSQILANEPELFRHVYISWPVKVCDQRDVFAHILLLGILHCRLRKFIGSFTYVRIERDISTSKPRVRVSVPWVINTGWPIFGASPIFCHQKYQHGVRAT